MHISSGLTLYVSASVCVQLYPHLFVFIINRHTGTIQYMWLMNVLANVPVVVAKGIQIHKQGLYSGKHRECSLQLDLMVILENPQRSSESCFNI